MKKELILLSLIIAVQMISIPGVTAQHGKVFDNLSMESKILNMERKYAIYLPPDYETSERSYPVLYLLHGHGDDQSGWIQFGEVMFIADKAIKEGKATPMIIVMPNGYDVYKGYFNDPKNEWRYEDFFFEEFMPYVESAYRIRGEKRYRAISGLSMGGGGTFIYALRHPELFSSACPLSAYCGPPTVKEASRYTEGRGWEDATEKEIETWQARHYAVDLIKAMPDSLKKAVRWYIDCGDDDFLYEGNSLVHIAMKKREIPHEFRIRDGAHTWTYWRESLPEVLSFITEAFHK